jgi:hypothetical protein
MHAHELRRYFKGIRTAISHLCAGDQVYLCYGHYNNLQLLELYGFMLEHNPHDEVRNGKRGTR